MKITRRQLKLIIENNLEGFIDNIKAQNITDDEPTFSDAMGTMKDSLDKMSKRTSSMIDNMSDDMKEVMRKKLAETGLAEDAIESMLSGDFESIDDADDMSILRDMGSTMKTTILDLDELPEKELVDLLVDADSNSDNRKNDNITNNCNNPKYKDPKKFKASPVNEKSEFLKCYTSKIPGASANGTWNFNSIWNQSSNLLNSGKINEDMADHLKRMYSILWSGQQPKLGVWHEAHPQFGSIKLAQMKRAMSGYTPSWESDNSDNDFEYSSVFNNDNYSYDDQ